MYNLVYIFIAIFIQWRYIYTFNLNKKHINSNAHLRNIKVYMPCPFLAQPASQQLSTIFMAPQLEHTARLIHNGPIDRKANLFFFSSAAALVLCFHPKILSLVHKALLAP